MEYLERQGYLYFFNFIDKIKSKFLNRWRKSNEK